MAGLPADAGEPQLVSPRSLRSTYAAKSETLIVAFCGIKGLRLPECFNTVFGATRLGSFHSDLGFLVSGGFASDAEQCMESFSARGLPSVLAALRPALLGPLDPATSGGASFFTGGEWADGPFAELL